VVSGGQGGEIDKRCRSGFNVTMMRMESNRRRRAETQPRVRGWRRSNWFALVIVAALAMLGVQCEPGGKPDIVVQNISNNEHASEYPCVVCDGVGHVVLAWTDDDGGDEVIMYVEKDEGGEWSPPQRMVDMPTGQRNVSLCYDRVGTLHAAWAQFFGPGPRFGWNIAYSHRPRGGTWAVAETLTYGVAVEPRISVDTTGAVHVLFADAGYGSNICYASRSTSGIWSSVYVLRGDYQGLGAPVLGVLADGTCVAAWVEQDNNVHWSIRTPAAGWQQPATMPADGNGAWVTTLAAARDVCYQVYMDTKAKVVALTHDLTWTASDTSFPDRGGYALAACIDTDGDPAVATATTVGGQALRVAVRVGSQNWRSCLVDSEYGVSSGLSLAVGPSGTMHLAWSSQDYPAEGEVYYAQVVW
jgi:hypothetical protein